MRIIRLSIYSPFVYFFKMSILPKKFKTINMKKILVLRSIMFHSSPLLLKNEIKFAGCNSWGVLFQQKYLRSRTMQIEGCAGFHSFELYFPSVCRQCNQNEIRWNFEPEITRVFFELFFYFVSFNIHMFVSLFQWKEIPIFH